MKMEEMFDYCESNRESDGFCRLCSSCSRPCPSNLACDYPLPEGLEIWRGGNYGSCCFEIEKENKD